MDVEVGRILGKRRRQEEAVEKRLDVCSVLTELVGGVTVAEHHEVDAIRRVARQSHARDRIVR